MALSYPTTPRRRSFMTVLAVATIFSVFIIQRAMAATVELFESGSLPPVGRTKHGSNPPSEGVSRRSVLQRTTAVRRVVTRSRQDRERRSSSSDPCSTADCQSSYSMTSVSSIGCPFGEHCSPYYDTPTDVETLCPPGDCPQNYVTSSSVECPSSECDCRTLHSTSEVTVRCTRTAHTRLIPSFQVAYHFMIYFI